jgi:hypothetical protein
LPSGNPGIDRKWEVLEKWLEEAVIEDTWAAFGKARMEEQ